MNSRISMSLLLKKQTKFITSHHQAPIVQYRDNNANMQYKLTNQKMKARDQQIYLAL